MFKINCWVYLGHIGMKYPPCLVRKPMGSMKAPMHKMSLYCSLFYMWMHLSDKGYITSIDGSQYGLDKYSYKGVKLDLDLPNITAKM